MLIVDGHLDLAHNALNMNRDLMKPVAEIRQDEADMEGKERGRNTVSLHELRRGNVGLFFATVHCRLASVGGKFPGVVTQEIAYAKAKAELAFYRILEKNGVLRLVNSRAALDDHMEEWGSDSGSAPLGFVLAMEGADPIVNVDQLSEWWDDGLRVASLSHYGISAYAHGTQTEGGLLPRAKPLLAEMESLGIMLDLSHLSDDSFWEALETFGGATLATHNCCRSLVPHDRQFADEQIRALIQRDGVIGIAFDAWMLDPLWDKENPDNSRTTLATVVDHVDHVCQLAGNANHAAIGSDLDGGFGGEQSPNDLDTIADLQKIPGILSERGYSENDIAQIMHGNWIRLLEREWS